MMPAPVKTTNPRLAHLVTQVDKASAAGRPGWLWDCEDAFREFLPAAREIAVDELNRALSAISKEPGHQSKSWDLRQISLVESEKYFLTCSQFIEPMDCLFSSSFQALIGVLGPGPLTCVRYRLPAQHVRDVLNVDEELVYELTESIQPGCYARLRGERDVLDFSSAAPTIVVRLSSPADEALHHCYDRLTRRPWMVQAADPASTQLLCLIDALADFADPSSLGAFEAVSRHPHHFVRWAAIRAMARIAPVRALSRVREAVEDAHPEVRTAARRTLAKAT